MSSNLCSANSIYPINATPAVSLSLPLSCLCDCDSHCHFNLHCSIYSGSRGGGGGETEEGQGRDRGETDETEKGQERYSLPRSSTHLLSAAAPPRHTITHCNPTGSAEQVDGQCTSATARATPNASLTPMILAPFIEPGAPILDCATVYHCCITIQVFSGG